MGGSPVQSYISEIQADINRYHHNIEDIENKHICNVVCDDFSDNAADIAKPNKNFEKQTFPFSCPGLP